MTYIGLLRNGYTLRCFVIIDIVIYKLFLLNFTYNNIKVPLSILALLSNLKAETSMKNY